MKSQLEHSDETEAIRSEIDTTRHRMDQTIDALGQRLKGRHLLDEALHLFRKQQENGNMTKLKNKISDSADTAYHSVVDTIKAHPVPIALVGAGVGWLIYERSRSVRASEDAEAEFSGIPPYDDDFSPETLPGQTLRSTSSVCEGIGSEEFTSEGFSEKAKGKASAAMQSIQQKASEARERLRETGAEAKEKARRIYETSRDKVSMAVEEHPLQSGLIFMGIGLVAGLLIPTPRRLSERLKPKARELGERVLGKAQDLMDRGSQVLESATQAASDEAKKQGLTSERNSA